MRNVFCFNAFKSLKKCILLGRMVTE